VYSLVLDNDIVTGKADLAIELLKPHEHVLEDRSEAFHQYLQSLGADIILPTVIVCSQSYMIVDGHHRVGALAALGFRSVPVTFVNYQSEKIATHKAGSGVDKKVLLDAAKTGNLLPPKTSCHQVTDYFGASHPIILISHLCHLVVK
jgi:hypothetical protein